MTEINSIKIEFLSRSSNESFARTAIACFAAQLDPTLEELGDIKTAVSEAVTNSIVHAYPDTLGRIMLRARLFDDNSIEITVRDWGCGIEDVARAGSPMFTTGGDDRSGMGFTIMESFMDNLRVRLPARPRHDRRDAPEDLRAHQPEIMEKEALERLLAAKSGDRDAADEMVSLNSGLIWSIARRYFGRGVDPDDLFQLGCVGFLKAVEGFDPSFGTQFSTYAVPKIAGEIRRFLRDDGSIKVSRSIKERAHAIRSAKSALEQRLGREPTLTELSAETGITIEEIAVAETGDRRARIAAEGDGRGRLHARKRPGRLVSGGKPHRTGGAPGGDQHAARKGADGHQAAVLPRHDAGSGGAHPEGVAGAGVAAGAPRRRAAARTVGVGGL